MMPMMGFGMFFWFIIPVLFLVGIIVAAINKKNQRIGDAAANTIVIRIKK